MANPLPEEKELYERIRSEGITINEDAWDFIYHRVNDNITAIIVICQRWLGNQEAMPIQEAGKILIRTKEIKNTINSITASSKNSPDFPQFQKEIPLNPIVQELITHQFGDDIYIIELILQNTIDTKDPTPVSLENIRKVLNHAQAIKEFIGRLSDAAQWKVSEEKYHALYDSFKDGLILTDMKINILDANQAYLDMLGYSKEEIKKLTHQQLTPEQWRRNEEDIVRGLIIKRDYADEYEKEYIKKDGTVFPVAISVWLIRNKQGEPLGTWSIVCDITESRKKEKESLDELLDSYMVINMISDGVTVSDARGRFEVFNARMKEITGYTVDEANQADDFNALIHPESQDHQDMLKSLSEIAKAKEYREAETVIRVKDGSEKTLLVSTSLIRYKNQDMFLSVWRDITERKELEEKLRNLASHDELTGCVNFRSTMDLLEKEIARSQRYQKRFSIVMIDIDDFKRKNDEYGHQVGNDILVAFANVIKNNLRSIDSVGRYGGDELIVILPETDAQQALVVLERMKNSLEQIKINSPHLDNAKEVRLKFSAGIAVFPHNAKDLKGLIWVADNALLQAKKEGKNRVVLEKRKFIRLNPVPGTRMEIVNSSGNEHTGALQIADISKEGMLFLSTQDIPGEEFLCRIFRPKNKSPFELTCKVKHKGRSENGLNRVGVYFADISESSQEKLLHCIESPNNNVSSSR